MAVFNATTVLNQIHACMAGISTERPAGAFTRSAYRFELDKEPLGGQDGTYFVDLNPVDPYERKWGTGEHIAVGTLTVRVAYFAGGGNTGDRFTVRRHAGDDAQLIADVIENPDNYNSSASGIRIIVFQGYSRVASFGKSEIWETRFSVQWRSDLVTGLVTDTMVASLILDTTAELSAYSVLSLPNGTGAVIPASATSDARLFFLDKDNVAGDAANGDDILEATGAGSPVWRESGQTTSSAEEPVVTLPGVMTVGGETDSTLEAWFEADRGVTFGAWSSGDGPVASAIADQSGKGSRNLTAVGTPLYIGDSINNKPGIRTSPTTPSYHRNTATNLITTDRGPRTVFFVGKASSSQGGGQVMFRTGTSGQFTFQDLSVLGLRIFHGTDASTQLGVPPGIDIDDIPHIWEWSYDGRYLSGEVSSADSAVRLLIDGVPVAINTNGGAPAGAETGSTGFVVGSREDSTQYGWLGEWSACLVFSSDLPAEFRTALRASYSRKYAIEVESPTTIMWAGDSHSYGTGSAATIAAGGLRQEMHSLHPNLLSVGSQYTPTIEDGIFNRTEGYSGATSGKSVGAFGTFIGGAHWIEIMAATKPDIIHLMIGANDPVASALTASQTATNVLDMVQYTGAVSPDTRFIITRAPLLKTTNSNAGTANPVITAQGAALQAALTTAAAPNVLVSPTYGNVCILPTIDDSYYVDDTHLLPSGWHQMITQAIHPFFVSVGL